MRRGAFMAYAPFVASLLALGASAAVTFGVVRELQGQRASMGACLANGIKRFLPVLGVVLLMSVAIFGASLLFVVPGLIVSSMLYVASPAAVIERPGVMGALKRSRRLTDGHKWPTFGMTFLFGLVQFLSGFALAAAFLHSPAIVFAELAAWILFGSFAACLSAVTYYFLRSEKEGITASELAQVFE